jgi:hypothetical protein
VLGSHRRGRECGAEADLAVDLSAAPRMEDGDREAAATAAEDFVVVKAAGDQGDLAASGESPVVTDGSEDAAPAAMEAAAAASKEEEPAPPESKAPTTKVRRGGCARNSGTPACLSNVPLLIKTVSSAEGWIRGRQRGEEDR